MIPRYRKVIVENSDVPERWVLQEAVVEMTDVLDTLEDAADTVKNGSKMLRGAKSQEKLLGQLYTFSGLLDKTITAIKQAERQASAMRSK